MTDTSGNRVPNLVYYRFEGNMSVSCGNFLQSVTQMLNFLYCSDAYTHWATCADHEKALSIDQKPTHIYGKFVNGDLMVGGGRQALESNDDFSIKCCGVMVFEIRYSG